MQPPQCDHIVAAMRAWLGLHSCYAIVLLCFVCYHLAPGVGKPHLLSCAPSLPRQHAELTGLTAPVCFPEAASSASELRSLGDTALAKKEYTKAMQYFSQLIGQSSTSISRLAFHSFACASYSCYLVCLLTSLPCFCLYFGARLGAQITAQLFQESLSAHAAQAPQERH